ncbi:hypothetical protein F4X86_00560 [Candidatus Saccharibacteria bacterium]|nr:hypothetical protein [Candidatus Saccharibacteria bacterium]
MADNIIRIISPFAKIWRGWRPASRRWASYCLLGVATAVAATATVFSLLARLETTSAVVMIICLVTVGYLVKLMQEEWSPAAVNRLANLLGGIIVPAVLLFTLLSTMYDMHQRDYGSGQRLAVVTALTAAMAVIIHFTAFGGRHVLRRKDS